MKAIIVCGGNPPDKNILKEELIDCDILIAADKGIDVLYKYDIKPNIVVGDFDSASSLSLDYFQKYNDIIFEKFPQEKDFTDSFGALKKAVDLNVNKICFLGCTGTRIDHVIGNIGLLYEGLKRNISCYIRDSYNLITLVNKSTCIKNRGFKYFSVQSYGRLVKELTLKGVKYPLNNYNLDIGNSLTLSNEFKNEKVDIQFKEGLLLIIQSRD